MPKQIVQNLIMWTVMIFLSGCTTSAGVRARSYVDDKPRVDQEMSAGNMGYMDGTPVTEDRSSLRKTRKVYVLEITRDVPDEEIPPLAVEPYQPPTQNFGPSSQQLPSREPIVIPDLGGVDYKGDEPTITELEDYVVEKDDTLQKIAKKFYNSYGKWTRIYEANKEAIKNPNQIKPGMTIKIPVAK